MDAYSNEVFSRAGELIDAPVIHSPALSGAVVEPPRRLQQGPRTFELPKGVFIAMGAAYLTFIAAMATAFGAGHGMGLVLAICLVYGTMYFGVPALMGAVDSGERRGAIDWSRLRRGGLDTNGGRMPAGAVLGQVLIVPFCVAGFGLAILAIVSTL